MNGTQNIFGVQPCLKDWNLINIPSEIREYPWGKSQKSINIPSMFIPDSRVCVTAKKIKKGKNSSNGNITRRLFGQK